MPTNICLQISKYSYATGQRDGSVPWTQITDPTNLFIVLKGIDTQVVDGQLSLEIIQGNKVLENVDVSAYIDKALKKRCELEHKKVVVAVAQLPIAGTARESAFAMRYMLNNGEARRIQLKMQSASACRQLVDCLGHRGMEFQEARPSTASRPRSTTTPMKVAPQDRAVTAHDTSPYFHASSSNSKPNPFTQHEVLEAGALSQRHGPQAMSSQGNSGQMPPPPFFTRDEATAPRSAIPERPTTSQIYRSYTTPSQQSQQDLPDMSAQIAGSGTERRSSASKVADFEAFRHAVDTDMRMSYDSTNQPEQSFLPQDSYDFAAFSSSELDSLNPAFLSSKSAEPHSDHSRPLTSATNFFSDTLEHEIPPRREFPLRPESWHNPNGGGESRPHSALSLPPLPKPTIMKESSSSPVRASLGGAVNAHSTTRPTTAMSSKRSHVAAENEVVRPGTVAGIRQRRADEPTSKKPQRSKSRNMNELLSNARPLAKLSNNAEIPRQNSLADAPYEDVSPPSDRPRLLKRSANGDTPGAVDPASGTRDPTVRAYDAIASSARDPNATSFNGYAEYTQTNRQAELERFFLENWDNEDFIALCEDMESCWRRIALGL